MVYLSVNTVRAGAESSTGLGNNLASVARTDRGERGRMTFARVVVDAKHATLLMHEVSQSNVGGHQRSSLHVCRCVSHLLPCGPLTPLTLILPPSHITMALLVSCVADISFTVFQFLAIISCSLAVAAIALACCRPVGSSCLSSRALGFGAGVLMCACVVHQVIAFSLAVAIRTRLDNCE